MRFADPPETRDRLAGELRNSPQRARSRQPRLNATGLSIPGGVVK